MEIEQSVWGFTPEGEAIILYTMRNSVGATVQLSNLGASVISVCVPDRNGVLADVVLGYKEWSSYLNDGPYLGKCVGRFANRIRESRFTLDGKEYRLTRNDGPNQLHGGPGGFANKIWASRVETDRVVFSIVSPDGDQGYPAEVGVEAVYDWNDNCELELTFYAKSDATTVLNLTNHTYFNLAGENSGSVLGHTLQLNASKWLPADKALIFTGEIAPVEGTPMDFRTPKALGRDIKADFAPLQNAKGYDTCLVFDDWQAGKLQQAGTLTDPVSGRVMEIHTTQPTIQLYTGNWLSGSSENKSGRGYNDYDGVALECQGYPDSVNHPEFVSARLEGGTLYTEKIIYKFTTLS